MSTINTTEGWALARKAFEAVYGLGDDGLPNRNIMTPEVLDYFVLEDGDICELSRGHFGGAEIFGITTVRWTVEAEWVRNGSRTFLVNGTNAEASAFSWISDLGGFSLGTCSR